MELVVAVYAASRCLPAEERYGLTSQMRRAAVSVAANIAEGHGRRRTNDYLRFLDIARGSLMELETHLQIAQRLGWFDPPVTGSCLSRSEGVARMLAGLSRSLRARTPAIRNPQSDIR